MLSTCEDGDQAVLAVHGPCQQDAGRERQLRCLELDPLRDEARDPVPHTDEPLLCPGPSAI